LADECNICSDEINIWSEAFAVSRSATIFKNHNAATHLPEMILSFRMLVEDALHYFVEVATTIDPFIKENIDPMVFQSGPSKLYSLPLLDNAAADSLQDIHEALDQLLSRHFILTTTLTPAMPFGQKFEPSNNDEAIRIICRVLSFAKEVLIWTKPGLDE
jgi:hypothetical protein